MRLDKYFSELGILSRSDTKKEIKRKKISVDGIVATKPEQQVIPGESLVTYEGKEVAYEPFVYYILHKPQGVITATEDREHKTVLDLLHEQFPEEGRDIFPVGRLDIDTEGLLLLTNDGKLSHELLSPAKHVEKTYFVRVAGIPTAEELRMLEEGVDIGDDSLTKPAKVHFLGNASMPESAEKEPCSELTLTITEGRYHQVKRMCAKVGHPVLYLKRLSFGPLSLDETLKIGEIRKISPTVF